MKKGLLATSALVGASLLGAPAMAAAPTVADNLALTITGNLRATLVAYTQDQVAGVGGTDLGKGYLFRGGDESEISFRARGKADNGLAFGFDIEVQTQTDDTTNSDETWMFIDSPTFGRIEIGDQDDAADRMMIGGEDAQAGRGGLDFSVTGGGMIAGTGITAVDGASATRSGDASKIIYFTPRFSGFQIGASFTPDTGQDGGENANDAAVTAVEFEDVVALAMNYQNTFSGARVTVGGFWQFGDTNVIGGGENLSIWGAGAQVVYAGFTFGVGYANHGDTGIATAGQDAGQWFDVGLMYTTGKWDFSAGYFSGWAGNPAGTDDSTHTQYAISASYRTAPGWDLRTDLIMFDYENRGRTSGNDNDGFVWVLSSIMTF